MRNVRCRRSIRRLSLILSSCCSSSSCPLRQFQNPQASELTKLENKSLVRYIYVGTPTAEFRKQYGAETRIQLNDQFAEVKEIGEYIVNERSSMKESDQGLMTVSIKADKETKMGVIADIKQELRRAYALKISYAATQRTSY